MFVPVILRSKVITFSQLPTCFGARKKFRPEGLIIGWTQLLAQK